MAYNKQARTQVRLKRLLSLLSAMTPQLTPQNATRQLSGINLAQYAKKLNLSVRSLQRDILFLKTCGYQIFCTERGRYVLKDKNIFQKISLSDKEATLLDLLKNLLREFDPLFNANVKKFDNFFASTSTQNPIFIKIPQVNLSHTGIQLEALLSSIRDKQLLHIRYLPKPKSSVQQLSFFHPLKICFFEGFWYLIGYLNEMQELLKLRLDKIQHIQNTLQFFDENERSLDVETVLNQATNMWFNPHQNRKVTLLVQEKVADYFKKKIYFPQQTIQELANGDLKLTCMAGEPQEIFPTIRFWLPHLEIISPLPWRNLFSAQLRQYLKQKHETI